MTWNYRVVRRKQESGVEEWSYAFGIHEAYYDKGKSKPHSVTQESIEPFGETLEELQRDFLMMADALTRPVLDYETREVVDGD